MAFSRIDFRGWVGRHISGGLRNHETAEKDCEEGLMWLAGLLTWHSLLVDTESVVPALPC